MSNAFPSDPPLLALNLTVRYSGGREVLRACELSLQTGETLGLAGTSGTGKSTLALAVLGLLPPAAVAQGWLRYRGTDLLARGEPAWRPLRGREIAYVPQSPVASLNPALRIGAQLAEAWSIHRRGPRQEQQSEIADLLRQVQLPTDEAFLRLYPRALSFGLAQRVLIAMAVMHRPALLVADEPTSALDILTQADILKLLRMLAAERGMALLYISHDLYSVAQLCDQVAVLHEGQIVERGATPEVFQHPRHPFVRRLMEALPVLPQSADAAGRRPR